MIHVHIVKAPTLIDILLRQPLLIPRQQISTIFFGLNFNDFWLCLSKSVLEQSTEPQLAINVWMGGENVI